MTKPKRQRTPNQGPRKKPAPQAERVAEPVQSSSRCTEAPPRRFSYIFRPTWHKVVGALVLLAGLTLFVACEASVGNIHAYGGHVWYLVGLAIAGSSAWWFGVFDQPA